jgi:hypothetical protein
VDVAAVAVVAGKQPQQKLLMRVFIGEVKDKKEDKK